MLVLDTVHLDTSFETYNISQQYPGMCFFSVAWRSRQVNLVAPRFPMQRWIVVSETWWASSFKIHLQTCPQTQITTYQTKSFHIWVLEYMGVEVMLCSLGWACWGLHGFFHWPFTPGWSPQMRVFMDQGSLPPTVLKAKVLSLEVISYFGPDFLRHPSSIQVASS